MFYLRYSLENFAPDTTINLLFHSNSVKRRDKKQNINSQVYDQNKVICDINSNNPYIIFIKYLLKLCEYSLVYCLFHYFYYMK